MKKDLKTLSKHFLIYGVGIYLTKLIGFFMIPIYTTYLTPADYGVLELLDLTMYVVTMFVGLGITNSIVRFYSDCTTDEERVTIISTAFFFVLCIAIIIDGILLLNSGTIASLLFQSGGESSYNDSQLSYFVKIVALSGILDVVTVIGSTFLQAEKKSALFSTISAGRFVITVSLNILFIVGMGLGALGVLYSQLISNVPYFFVMLFFMRKKLGFRISMAKAKEMAKYGTPLIVSTLSMFIIHFSDRYFLERFSGLSILGVYSLSYKFAMILTALFYAPFEMIWGPLMFDLYKKGEEGRKTINFINKYLLIGSLAFITGYSLCVKHLIFIMADPKFYSAYKVVPVLLVAFLFIGLSSISTCGIFFSKKTIYRALANVYSAIIALLGYFFLIKFYGYWGAVITTLVALLVRYIALSIYSQRFYRLEYNPVLYIKAVGGCAVAYWAGSLISIDNNYVALFVKGLAGVTIFGVSVYILRVFNRYELGAAKSILGNMWIRLKGAQG